MNAHTIDHAQQHIDNAGYLLRLLGEWRENGVPNEDGGTGLLPPVLVQAVATEANAHISLAMGMLLVAEAEDMASAGL